MSLWLYYRKKIYIQNSKMEKTIDKNTKITTSIWAIIWIVSFVVSIVAWCFSLTNRVVRLEEFQASVNIVEIQTTLKEIQTDISRIKSNMIK